MIIFRMIISGIIALSLVIYFFYVFVVSNPCERLSRATKPIDLGASLVISLSEPWSSQSTLDSLEVWSAKARLKTAVLLRIQFYSKSEQPIICDWDKYVETVNANDLVENNAQELPEYNGGAE